MTIVVCLLFRSVEIIVTVTYLFSLITKSFI